MWEKIWNDDLDARKGEVLIRIWKGKEKIKRAKEVRREELDLNQWREVEKDRRMRKKWDTSGRKRKNGGGERSVKEKREKRGKM